MTGCCGFTVLFGSNANNGSNAGLSYSNANNPPSNANANISSQLSYETNDNGKTLPLGKKSRTNPKGAGSASEGSEGIADL